MILLKRISTLDCVDIYTLNFGLTTVGRDLNSDIHLNNSFVSRHHALIDIEDNGRASVTDLGSSNGSYINSQRLTPKDFFTIEDGDILSFGVDTFVDDATGLVFKVTDMNDSNVNQQSDSHNRENDIEHQQSTSENGDMVRDCSVVLQRLSLENGCDRGNNENNRMEETEEEPFIRKRRLSQDSIENDDVCSKKIKNQDDEMDYTMDDIVICDDDDDEEFPCSQIFDDVQEKMASDSDHDEDEIFEIDDEGDDENDEFDENERQWIRRLSQNFDCPIIKEEPIVISDDDVDINHVSCDVEKECDLMKVSKQEIEPALLPEEVIDNEIKSLHSKNDQFLEEGNDNEKASNCKNLQVPEEIFNEITSNDENVPVSKTSIEDSSSESEDNLINNFKPKTKSVGRRQIKLVEAIPLTTNRRTRSKETKNRSNLTKVNAPPLKPKLTRSQKSLRKERLKSLASVDNSNTVTTEENDNKTVSSHSKVRTSVKVTSKNRNDILVDSLLNQPSTSGTFKIPKLKKSNPDESNSPAGELNLESEVPIAGCSSFVPKQKSVSFNDQIQCQEIEAIGKRKFQVSKLDNKSIRRADQAIPMPMRQTYHNQTCKLDEIFSYILRWSVCWLEEEKKFAVKGVSRKPPPVGFEIPITSLPHEFQNYFDYYKRVLPLALLEMWAKISNDYFKKPSQVYFVKVDHHKIEDLEISMLPNSTACRQQVSIYCHTYITEKQMRDGYIRIGDFGIVELQFNIKGKNKNVYINVFCYAKNVTKSRFTKSPSNEDASLIENLKLNHSNLQRLDLELLIKLRSDEEELVQGVVVRIKIISYIRPTLKHFDSLLNLQTSPLMPAILKPSTFDFTVDELKIRKPFGKLNPAQERAVAQATKLCLGSKPNIALIHGPPGTGKSHVIINLIQNIISVSTHTFKNRPRILLCAPTNAAIDQLVLKLKDLRSTLPEMKKFNLIRTGNVDKKSPAYQLTPERLAENELNTLAHLDSEEHELELKILQAKKTGYANLLGDLTLGENEKILLNAQMQAIDESLKRLVLNVDKVDRFELREKEICIIKKADIIATTLSSCNNEQIKNALTDNNREDPAITCCIIDEAAQCNETELLLPLTLGVTKIVLVGDPLQLTATTFSEVSRQMGYGNSIFSRIYNVCKDNLRNISPIYFLDTQYRMQASIASWPSKFVYEGRLKTNDSNQKDSELNSYMLINHSFTQSKQSETNNKEAELVVSVAYSILKKTSIKTRVGVITPYSNQRRLIQSQIHQRSNSEVDLGTRLEVNSIDGFQGQERDVIIVSLVRSDGIGFMAELQRINVMLTRAEKCLIVCANFKTFLTNNIWRDLYEDGCRRKKVFVLKDLDQKNVNSIVETIFRKKRSASRNR